MCVHACICAPRVGMCVCVGVRGVMHRVGRTLSRCQEEEQSGRREEPNSGRSSGQTEKDDDKDTDRDREQRGPVTHP